MRLVVAALLACVASVCAQASASRAAEPGEYAVGFERRWVLDESRSYRSAWDDGETLPAGPRPLLVNLWYPARTPLPEGAAEPMPHAAYLDILVTGQLEPFSRALRDFAREVATAEITGTEELAAGERARFERFLQARTTAHRGVPPAEGRFPLVLYHAGAGSSFEDNARLCELLASRGFVVLGSAFQDASGDSLETDGGDGSAADLGFLVRWADAELPFADAERVGMLGHSLGAQAILTFAATGDSPAVALVALDTTQDYYALGGSLHARFVARMRAGASYVTQHVLFAAGPAAVFQLADGLERAPRTYLTLPHLDHNEYLSQGLQRLDWLTELQAEAPTAEGARQLEHADAIRAEYAELCRYVAAFLEHTLDDRGDALAVLDRRLAATELGAGVHVEHVATGVDGPAAYALDSADPPTPRQLGPLVESEGAAAAVAVLTRFRDREPPIPILSGTMGTGSTLFALVESGELEEARTLYAFLETVQPTVLGLLEFLADFAELLGRPDEARRVLAAVVALDPEYGEAAERLAGLEESGAD